MSKLDGLLLWLFRTDIEHIDHTDWYLVRYGRDRK